MNTLRSIFGYCSESRTVRGWNAFIIGQSKIIFLAAGLAACSGLASGGSRSGWRASEAQVVSEGRQLEKIAPGLKGRAAEIEATILEIEAAMDASTNDSGASSEISLHDGPNFQTLTIRQATGQVEYWLRPGINSADLSAIRLNPSSTRLLTIYGREMRVLQPKDVTPVRIITNVSDAQWVSDSRFAAIQNYRASEVNLYNFNGEQINTLKSFQRDRATLALVSFAHSGKLTINGNDQGDLFSLLVNDGGGIHELPSDRQHLFCGLHHVSLEPFSTPPRIFLENTQVPLPRSTTQNLAGASCSDSYLLIALSNTRTLSRSVVAIDLKGGARQAVQLQPTQSVRFLNQSLTSVHAVPFVVYSPDLAPQIHSYNGSFGKIRATGLARLSTVKAKDGERIPLIHLPAENHSDKALLIVYGAYGKSALRGARSELLALRKRGFHIYIAEVRGGGAEFKAKAWADAGRFAGKELTISDTIAAAQHLKSKHKTLVVYGRSAGGLIAMTAAARVPELFSGVVLENPLLDLKSALTDQLAPFAKIEALEWGEAAAQHIDRLSPMHVKLPPNLPPIALIVGLNDDLVSPAKAFAFAKKIRAAGGTAIVIADRYAGHSGDDTDAGQRGAKARIAGVIEWVGDS